jgi:RNA polymerase-binding transcription factor DksA
MSGNVEVGSAPSGRHHDLNDMAALAWDLRVRQLESEFALSALRCAHNTQEDCERERRARERALAGARIAATRWAIKEIDAALTRIENGDYGNCEWCSRPIPHELLTTAPIGRLCDRCRTRD